MTPLETGLYWFCLAALAANLLLILTLLVKRRFLAAALTTALVGAGAYVIIARPWLPPHEVNVLEPWKTEAVNR